MAFLKPVSDILAYRSAYICNFPSCNALTVGPAYADPALRLKKGEGAHIIGEKPASARHDPNYPSQQLGDAENGIWLCASCHTIIDKNNGADFSVEELRKWKEDHEAIIRNLLLSHKSPLPLLRQGSINLQHAQGLADQISSRGALFVEYSRENWNHVNLSIEELRAFIRKTTSSISNDNSLRGIFTKTGTHCAEYMNSTSKNHKYANAELTVLRNRVGVQLQRLIDEYGCKVSGDILSILPQ